MYSICKQDHYYEIVILKVDFRDSLCSFMGVYIDPYKPVQMEPNGPVRVHLVPFVHCQSYRLVRVNLDPHKGTQRVPEIHVENHCSKTLILNLFHKE